MRDSVNMLEHPKRVVFSKGFLISFFDFLEKNEVLNNCQSEDQLKDWFLEWFFNHSYVADLFWAAFGDYIIGNSLEGMKEKLKDEAFYQHLEDMAVEDRVLNNVNNK